MEVARAPGAPEMQATAASSARKVLTCVARVTIHGAAPVTFPEVLGLEDKATGRRDAWLQGPGRRALSRTTTQLAETVKSNHVGILGTDPKASVHDTL